MGLSLSWWLMVLVMLLPLSPLSLLLPVLTCCCLRVAARCVCYCLPPLQMRFCSAIAPPSFFVALPRILWPGPPCRVMFTSDLGPTEQADSSRGCSCGSFASKG